MNPLRRRLIATGLLSLPAHALALPPIERLDGSLFKPRDAEGRMLQAEAGQLFPEFVQSLARHL